MAVLLLAAAMVAFGTLGGIITIPLLADDHAADHETGVAFDQ